MQFDSNNNPSDDDDDVIDLTEIIEKGNSQSAPAPSASQDVFGAGANTQKPEAPAEMEMDLDALLAQMDSDGGFSHLEEAVAAADEAAAEAAAAAAAEAAAQEVVAGVPSFDTDDGLGDSFDDDGADSGENLPDMADIDALLADMDMPEQPADAVVKAPSVASGAASGAAQEPQPQKSANEVDAEMDALLESILDDKPAKAPVKAPAKAPAPDPDEVSSAMDDLFDSVAQTAGVVEDPVPGATAQNDTSTASVAQQASSGDDDFDALFDEVSKAPMDEPTAAPKASPEATPEAPSSEPSEDEVLDMLFEAGVAPEPKATQKPKTGPVITQKSTPVVAKKPAPESVSVADMDDIFGSAAPSAPTATAPSTPAEHVPSQQVKDLEERLRLLEEHMALRLDEVEKKSSDDVQGVQVQMTALEEQIVALMARVERLEEQGELAAQETAALAARISQADAHTQSAVEENSAQMAVQLADVVERLASMEGQQANTTQDTSSAQDQALLAAQETLQQNMISVSERLIQLETLVETHNTDAAQSDVQNTVQSAIHEATAQEISTLSNRVMQLEAQSVASPVNPLPDVSVLIQRLDQMEQQGQVVAREMAARDEAAREALEAYIDKLESVAKEAVAKEAVAYASLSASIANLENIQRKYEDVFSGFGARMNSFEERLHQYEAYFTENIERMATQAAARVLREEIAALLSED